MDVRSSVEVTLRDPQGARSPRPQCEWSPGAGAGRTRGAEMAFKTMAPEFRVTLYKTVARRMVTGSDGRTANLRALLGGNRVIDLTPFFGDGKPLETSKSVQQPAGQWAMTVRDQMEAEKMDSLYGLIEPMDVVEIRMRHRPDPAAAGVSLRW